MSKKREHFHEQMAMETKTPRWAELLDVLLNETEEEKERMQHEELNREIEQRATTPPTFRRDGVRSSSNEFSTHKLTT